MFRPGAIVRFPFGTYDHVGLVTDEGTLLHSSKEDGVVVEEPIAKWLHHPGARIERTLDWIGLQHAKLFGRARLGQKWSLFDNCEHFISEITTGIKKSPQLQAAIAAVLVLGILVALKYGR